MFPSEHQDFPGDYTRFLNSLCDRNEDMSCYILSTLAPYLVKDDLPLGNDLFRRNYSMLVSHCNQCKRSHRWVSIKRAIEYDHVLFLRAVVESGKWWMPLPFSYRKFSRLILATQHPDEIRGLIEGMEPSLDDVLSWRWKPIYSWYLAKSVFPQNGVSSLLKRYTRFVKELIKHQNS